MADQNGCGQQRSHQGSGAPGEVEQGQRGSAVGTVIASDQKINLSCTGAIGKAKEVEKWKEKDRSGPGYPHTNHGHHQKGCGQGAAITKVTDKGAGTTAQKIEQKEESGTAVIPVKSAGQRGHQRPVDGLQNTRHHESRMQNKECLPGRKTRLTEQSFDPFVQSPEAKI